MERRVVVTGLGVISPVGNDVPTFWSSLVTGKSGVDVLKSFDADGFDSQIAGEVKNFDPLKYMNIKEVRRADKFVQYAVASSIQAVNDSGIDFSKENLFKAGVLIGSGIGSLNIVEEESKKFLTKGPSRLSPFLIPMLIINEAAGHVSIHYRLKGPNSAVATACASGSHAIGDAFKIIQRNAADIMITGGTESCITHLGVGGFCALKALSTRNDNPKGASRPFDRDRDGFVMAEGCGIVVLEELNHAKKRNARIYGEIAGYAMTGDGYHITAPDPTGESATYAMRLAIDDAKLRTEDIDYINAHGTSTSLNDKIETLAIKNVFGAHAKKVAISSTKSVTGHLLGAAGGVEFVACALAIRDGVIPPTINYETADPECDLDYVPNEARKTKVDVCLSNSLGFGGHNAVLIIKRFKD